MTRKRLLRAFAALFALLAIALVYPTYSGTLYMTQNEIFAARWPMILAFASSAWAAFACYSAGNRDA